MAKRKNKPYHRRWHGDAIGGYRKLSLELRGAYTTLLDEMYDHGGPIEERFVCAWLDCDIRVWKRIRVALIDEHHKIRAYTDAAGVSWLVNDRAQSEMGLPTYDELTANLAPKFPIANAELSPTSAEIAKENNATEIAKAEEKASLIPLPLPPNSVPIGTGAERPAKLDLNKEAWDRAVVVLTADGRFKPPAARTFFGKLLSANALEAADLLPAIIRCQQLATPEPAPYLRKSAEAISARRGGAPQALDTPEEWDDGRWRAAVTIHLESGCKSWGERLGPPPGEPGCRVPAHILAEARFPIVLEAVA